MSRYKVCVYAICKNEEKFVDRWMDAVQEADLVVVLDTGSLDMTVEKLKARGAHVDRRIINPWRFDEARNMAMDLIPEDVDICVSNDLDEVFEPGWREKLERAWSPSHTRARYHFTWSYKPDGSPDKQFIMEKIHGRSGFRWVHPVHEVLEYSGSLLDNSVYIPHLVLNHYPDLSKPRAQYLPLLELSADENPQDSQTVFWLGREYMYHKNYDSAIATLAQYLSLSTSLWNEERSAAMRFIAKCHWEKQEQIQARQWLYRAIAECPAVREPYLYMARLAYHESDWDLAQLMVEKGLEIQQRQGSYLLELEAWGSELYDYGAIACYHLGRFEKAMEYGEAALSLSPKDTRLQSNLAFIREKFQAMGGEPV